MFKDPKVFFACLISSLWEFVRLLFELELERARPLEFQLPQLSASSWMK
jgi:hypothetical protein